MADVTSKTEDPPVASVSQPASSAALKPRPPRARNPRMRPPDPEAGDLSRRNFVYYSIAGFITLLIVSFCRFFFPRVLFEPKTRFTIGYPDEFGFGVDTKYQNKYRIWVCRGASGLYVIFARCTHLGCTPDWLKSENKFKCPCHGSGYDIEGVNYEGPAPMPMLRCHLNLDALGRIVVDKLQLYEYTVWKDAKPSLDGPMLAV